jgi:hypothetical protein
MNYYHGTRVEGLRKTMKPLNQDNRFPGRDLNLEPSGYESGVLTIRPRHFDEAVQGSVKVKKSKSPSNPHKLNNHYSYIIGRFPGVDSRH